MYKRFIIFAIFFLGIMPLVSFADSFCLVPIESSGNVVTYHDVCDAEDTADDFQAFYGFYPDTSTLCGDVMSPFTLTDLDDHGWEAYTFSGPCSTGDGNYWGRFTTNVDTWYFQFQMA